MYHPSDKKNHSLVLFQCVSAALNYNMSFVMCVSDRIIETTLNKEKKTRIQFTLTCAQVKQNPCTIIVKEQKSVAKCHWIVIHTLSTCKWTGVKTWTVMHRLMPGGQNVSAVILSSGYSLCEVSYVLPMPMWVSSQKPCWSVDWLCP